MDRIYGKPTETVVNSHPGLPGARCACVDALEEKLELLHRLREGEPVALPVIEPDPPTGWAAHPRDRCCRVGVPEDTRDDSWPQRWRQLDGLAYGCN
jgi:hypothetical protein